MQSKAPTVKEYIASLPEDRREPMQKLRNTINKNIPSGFHEEMSYGMIGWAVPHDLYPAGYHCDPSLPLPFLNLASQKNTITIYHMGIYANQELFDRFQEEYQKISKKKIAMGKSCIKFSNMEGIPYDLIGKLVARMTVQERICLYETVIKKK